MRPREIDCAIRLCLPFWTIQELTMVDMMKDFKSRHGFQPKTLQIYSQLIEKAMRQFLEEMLQKVEQDQQMENVGDEVI